MSNCIWLTNGLNIKPVNHNPNNSISVTNCCRSKNDPWTIKQLPENIRYAGKPASSISQYLTQIKDPNYNYQNVKDTVCRTCTDAETTTGTSTRVKFNNFHLRHGDPKVPGDKIGFIHITFGNFCNFSCRYCGTHSSTEWNKDVTAIKELYKEPTFKEKKFSGLTEIFMTERENYEHEKDVLKDLEKQDLKELQYIGVFGGEPFLSRHWQQFVELLDMKTDLSKVVMQINSNFSTFPKPHIIELFKKFRYIDLRISNEAVGPLAEYIRHGMNFQKFEANIKKWQEVNKEYKNIVLTPHMTNSVYNINKIVEFDEWAHDMNILNGPIKATFVGYVYNPSYLDIRRVLNNKQLDKCNEILDTVKTLTIKQDLKRFISNRSFQDEQPKMLQEFKDYTKTVDSVRNQKLQDVNPELYDWLY